MLLYSKNNGYPQPLPQRLRLPSGETRTDPSTFTAEDLVNAGYVEAPPPPSVDYPNELNWSGVDWLVVPPSVASTITKQNTIMAECLKKLAESDYKILKALEVGASPAPEVVAYRQQLRDLYNTVETLDPWGIVLPVL